MNGKKFSLNRGRYQGRAVSYEYRKRILHEYLIRKKLEKMSYLHILHSIHTNYHLSDRDLELYMIEAKKRDNFKK